LRKRNLRQPIKSSLLPYARFESGSWDDLIGWRSCAYASYAPWGASRMRTRGCASAFRI